MKISEVPVPEVYKEESADFRFFLDWFDKTIGKIQYDIENIPDLYDPTRCPDWLLWMLADSMGFKYDDRLPTSFNRLVLVYFMSMIRNKGSKDGVTLAAETNLAQFNILDYGKEKDILYNRLEDTSIPVNSVYVTPHTDQGFIEVVYFSDKVPIDACIEYVRPLGMYCFQHAGVKFDARMKLAIDARLTSSPNNLGMSIGPTHVGHYSREDYARMQKIKDSSELRNTDEFRIKMHDLNPIEKDIDGNNDIRKVSGSGIEATYILPHRFHNNISDSSRSEDYTASSSVENETSYIQNGGLSDDLRYSSYHQEGMSKREAYQNSVMQARRSSKSDDSEGNDSQYEHIRQPVYYRNSDYEKGPTENESSPYINPGYRSLFSLQLCNNEHIVRSLIPIPPSEDDKISPPNYPTKDRDKIFGLGYTPTDVTTFDGSVPLIDEETTVFRRDENGNLIHEDVPVYKFNDDGTVTRVYPDRTWNLRYDYSREVGNNADDVVVSDEGPDVWTIDDERSNVGSEDNKHTRPRPAVNSIMTASGDAMSLNSDNSQYVLRVDDNGNYPPKSEFIQNLDDLVSDNDTPILKIYKIKSDGELDGDPIEDSNDVVRDDPYTMRPSQEQDDNNG